VISSEGIAGDDERLSDLINADGRLRLANGLTVDLSRYLEEVPGLPESREALDTAIEMSLRSSCSRGESAESAANSLVKRFPALEQPIRTASMLGDVLCSTDGLSRSLADAGRELPQEFGPVLREGRRRYELRELIGTGAHGAVYLAADRQLSDRDRPAWVAI